MLKLFLYIPVSLVVASFSQTKIQRTEHVKFNNPNCMLKRSIQTSQFQFTSQFDNKYTHKNELGHYNKKVQTSFHHNIFYINRGGGNDSSEEIFELIDEDKIDNGATSLNEDSITVINDSDYNDNKEKEDDDAIILPQSQENSITKKVLSPNQTISHLKDQWIASFRSQIQDIRMEMEREATIELENVKKEILKMRDMKEQTLLSTKNYETEKSLNLGDEGDSNNDDSETLEECTINPNEDGNDIDNSETQHESKNRLHLPQVNKTLCDDKGDSHKFEGSLGELVKESIDIEENDEFLIIGNTDESGDDVLERLAVGQKEIKNGRTSYNISNTVTVDNKIKNDESKEFVTPPRRRKKKSLSQKGGQRKSTKIKKNKAAASNSGSTLTTSNLEPLTKKEISTSLSRRITGRVIQGIILLIGISLVVHILLGAGGGVQIVTE